MAQDISLWLGGIVGAGLFACTGVMAIIMVVAGTGVPIQPQVFTRDVAFRSLANALLLTAAYLQVVSAVFAVVMIVSGWPFGTVSLFPSGTQNTP